MSFASFAKRVIKRSRAPYAAYVAQTRKPILQNMCLLEAGQGKNINGNMFALARAIETLPQYAHLRAAFVVTEDTESQARDRFSHYGIDGVELVARNSLRYKELLARAHYLFTDNSLPTYFFKRDGQVYVNTWHGTPSSTSVTRTLRTPSRPWQTSRKTCLRPTTSSFQTNSRRVSFGMTTSFERSSRIACSCATIPATMRFSTRGRHRGFARPTTWVIRTSSPTCPHGEVPGAPQTLRGRRPKSTSSLERSTPGLQATTSSTLTCIFS
ncbi:hypothetical protein B5F23_01360 [Olsenella sp. An188]|nr:hypothetical protein B5F23_01360 [Olsenella sp. An188]